MQWEETCSSCRTAYQEGYNRTQHARKAEEMARRAQGNFQQVAPGEGAVQVPHLRNKAA